MSEQEPNKPNPSVKLRAQAEVLLSQAKAQLADIQHALRDASGDNALQSRLSGVAAQTGAAMAQISLALNGPASALRPSDLAALEGVVHSSETTTLLAEAATQAALARNVAVTAAANRAETQSVAHDLFDRKIFDAYLHFASPEDEADYRKREAEARKYVEAQLAKHTPEGDLNASGGTLGQMFDAHAHGAGASPDFMPRFNALAETAQHQRAAMQAAGQSTAEYDRNIAASVRRFLKDEKHLSDAEIDKLLTNGGDPLEVVKPFIKDDADSRHLEKITTTMTEAAHTATTALPRVVADNEASGPKAPLTIDPDAINAKLQAAGLQTDVDAEATGHGLATTKPAGKQAAELGG
jgi:hypothetical protein